MHKCYIFYFFNFFFHPLSLCFILFGPLSFFLLLSSFSASRSPRISISHSISSQINFLFFALYIFLRFSVFYVSRHVLFSNFHISSPAPISPFHSASPCLLHCLNNECNFPRSFHYPLNSNSSKIIN